MEVADPSLLAQFDDIALRRSKFFVNHLPGLEGQSAVFRNQIPTVASKAKKKLTPPRRPSEWSSVQSSRHSCSTVICRQLTRRRLHCAPLLIASSAKSFGNAFTAAPLCQWTRVHCRACLARLVDQTAHTTRQPSELHCPRRLLLLPQRDRTQFQVEEVVEGSDASGSGSGPSPPPAPSAVTSWSNELKPLPACLFLSLFEQRQCGEVERVDVIGCAEQAPEEHRPIDGGDEDSVRTATA